MDIINHYKALIKKALTDYATFLTLPPKPSYQVITAFDDEHQQYLVRKVGWTDNEWIHQTVLHVAIYEGKIWIEEDWTEEGIATFLLDQGVPKEDIVLGFQPPQFRMLSEFAVA